MKTEKRSYVGCVYIKSNFEASILVYSVLPQTMTSIGLDPT